MMTTLSAAMTARCGSPGDQQIQTVEISTGMAYRHSGQGLDRMKSKEGQALRAPNPEQHACCGQHSFGKKEFLKPAA